MSGKPDNSPLKPALTDVESAVLSRLQEDVEMLAGLIGVRHDSRPTSLDATVAYLEKRWQDLGQTVMREVYPTARWQAKNLVVEWPGQTKLDEIVILGAHYDTVSTTPGADDNASAVAMMLSVCELLTGKQTARTLRFVAFANEEPPHFIGPTMGSRVYAKACKARGDHIHAMVCLEMVGYFDTSPESQAYPDEVPSLLKPLLRSRGDFLAFVGDMPTRRPLRKFTRGFKSAVKFPVISVPIPRQLVDLWLSDHGPFWDEGYPAMMITDTSWFRNPHYHEMSDTPETLDYERMARATLGVAGGVAALARST